MVASGRAAAVAALPQWIAFLGFGLIGGSVAHALREAGCGAHLAAWTPSGLGPAEGLRRGVLDSAAPTPEAAIAGAGLVVLAGPPLAVVAMLANLAGPLRGALDADATITDVASTKAWIVAAAEAGRLPFVGGHPMAGRERSGFGAADATLFVDRPWVIVPGGASPGAITTVEALVRAVGARPVHMSPEEHDVAAGAISHLPLVASAALVDAVAADRGAWTAARGLAAGGWRDMTRLARGDAAMGAGILATNAGPAAAWLRAYRDAIDGWIRDLEADGDPDARADRLQERLASARARLELDPPG